MSIVFLGIHVHCICLQDNGNRKWNERKGVASSGLHGCSTYTCLHWRVLCESLLVFAVAEKPPRGGLGGIIEH